ncbi:MAG TPA: TetR family transcriptional regulator [Leptospiraceae bacterium]|nr:TetR family transcriptional regulator [Leptospiraceae bacterium]HMY66022.1 TetR family transcriptional regulator [Leptospiraceae bacterium]HMZ59950.1 TetR family transcriptional regulator [Leptospiraceae bacterium]HNF15471.1 TetR family transcriptional regulator [Leptospiraceae bacterium]HNM06736.1 TetR family transcriptional regulator [Leptospiraceae bacterium]
MNRHEDTTAKEEILEKIILALSRKGLNNLSLREIAKEIGSSGRMIIYYFKSYDLLINSVFIHLSTKHKRNLKTVFSENRNRTFSEAADIYIRQIFSPENRRPLLLFLELYTKAARHPAKHKSFFKEVLFKWITEIQKLIAPELTEHSEYYASMIISFYRGLLMDWLASEDTERILNANAAFTRLISGLMKDHRKEYKKEKNNGKNIGRKQRNAKHAE